MSRAERMGCVRGVYALIDDDPRWPHAPRAQLEAALAGGVSVLQLRLKHTADGAALALAREMVRAAHAAGAVLFVNDRFDLALLAGADGVHLGADDLAPELLPADARARLLVGLSTHTREQVHASRTRPIDYVAFGPVFGTASKESEYAPRGLEALRAAVAGAAHPLVAIGGIGAENIADVAASGAVAAAVISALAAAAAPARAARELAARFGAGARAAQSVQG